MAACALFAAVIPVLVADPAMASPCTTSTAANQSYADAPADAEDGLAPEITGVTATLDGTCNLSLAYAIPQPDLVAGESVSWYLNTDGNEGSGEPAFGGADYNVLILGRAGQDDTPKLIPWQNGTFDVAAMTPLGNAGPFGFTASINQINGLASGGALTFVGLSMYRGIYDTYSDFAPEVTAGGQKPPFSFPLAFSAAAQTPAAGQQTAGTTAGGSCKVPLLKGLTIKRAKKRLKARGCGIGKTKYRKSKKMRGRVLRTTPARGQILAQGAKVSLVVGRNAKKGKRKARKSSIVNELAAVLERDVAVARAR